MFRTSDVVLIAVMVGAAAFTYKTKQEAEHELSTVRKLERSIKFEQDSIDLLAADWSLLTQPVRLQKLVEAYQADLALQPVDAHQFARISEVPLRPLGIRDIIGQSIEATLEDVQTDDMATGAVTE